MKTEKLVCSVSIVLTLILFSCGDEIRDTVNPISEQHPQWKKYFDSAKVQGTFVLYDYKKNKWNYSDSAEAAVQFIPASTFKILNSLISLECGSVKNENEIFKWDGVKRRVDSWNADTDLKSAFKNSTVWFYQECARRTGAKKMKEFLDSVDFGNKDTSGGIDLFWLKGGLRINPIQQINFLKKLYENKLPFQQKNIDIVKRIMISEDPTIYKLRCKTGWGFTDSSQVGWYIGYIEKANEIYFFSTFVQSKDTTNENFGKCRKEITNSIIRDLNILKNN